MELAYQYEARNSQGKSVQGYVYAPNAPLAHAKLRRAGFTPLLVRLSLNESVSSLTSGGAFNQVELARFYTTLGRRARKGRPLVEGLEAAAEYVSDKRLRQAIMVMRQGVLDGLPEHAAMLRAGFPERDALVIKATAEAGKVGDTLISLAEEIRRALDLRRRASAIFRMPLILAMAMYAFFYGALVFFAPTTMEFLAQTNLKMSLPAFNVVYFEFATWFNKHLVPASVGFWAIPVGLFFLFRSDLMRRQFDHWKRYRDISEKSDHATIWRSFALLYDAAIPLRETARILADAAKRPDTRTSLLRLSKLAEAGRELDDAVLGSHFPSFVTAGVASAVSSGDVAEGLMDMVFGLEEDVETLIDIVSQNLDLLSKVVLAVGLLGVVMVTYYPIASSVLSNF